jgi:hypothetical protein
MAKVSKRGRRERLPSKEAEPKILLAGKGGIGVNSE